MAEYGLNLWDYSRIIYKRKWIILSIFIVSVISANIYGNKSEPIYRATVTLNVDTRQPIAEITGSGVTFWGAASGGQLTTQLELMKSYSILREVALKLGEITPQDNIDKVQASVVALRNKITVDISKGTSLVDITVSDIDPQMAKRTAEILAHVYIQKEWEKKTEEANNTKRFVEKQLSKLDQTITEIKQKLNYVGVSPMEGQMSADTTEFSDLKTRLVQLKLRLADLQERYTDNYPGIINTINEMHNIEKQLGMVSEEVRDDVMAEMETIDADKLKNELEINQKLYAILKEQYEKALLLEASKTKGIEIVNPPMVPRMPYTVPAAANLFFGAVIGLVLGLVAALITESMDTSIGTIEDVEEYLRLPVLGVIPHIVVDKSAGDDYWKTPPPPDERKKYTEVMGRLVTQYKPRSPITEAYRNLQTYIKFSGLDKLGNCLMFTSAGVREGKTITSVNSALSMAQMGYKVLLVDADLRRPSVHKVFGIDKEMGLTEAVLGMFKLEDVIKTMDDIMMGNIKSSMVLKTYGMENLNIITSGHLPSNPTEILSSQNMSALIKEVKEKFQVVLIDSAPILPVTDSCILSSKVDGVILVYEVGRVSRGALRRSKLQLESAKGKPIGVVLNSMRASDMRFGSPFYYYYQKYYGEEHPEGKDSLRK